MNRIKKKFDKLALTDSKALITYIVAVDPDLDSTLSIMNLSVRLHFITLSSCQTIHHNFFKISCLLVFLKYFSSIEFKSISLVKNLLLYS